MMSEAINGSTSIKLFGRTISQIHNIHVFTNDSSLESELVLPISHDDFSDHSPLSSFSSPLEVNSPSEHEAKRYKDTSWKEFNSLHDDDVVSKQTTEDLNNPSYETETYQQNSTKYAEQIDISQDKSLKKPDKIVPCPRCKSMDTKFCYYNNYNIKQPRHFCKKCQRYWTSGGSMRTMLVGAGRRKNKISPPFPTNVSDYPQMSTVLTFGSDSSMISSNSHEETFDNSNRCFFPTQFPWNPAMPYSVSFYPDIAYYGGFSQPSWNVQSITTESCDPSKPSLGNI